MRRLADRERLDAFMQRLGASPIGGGRVYFTGGATALLFGWRSTTIDVDVALDSDAERLLREIPRLKEELQLNVELAAPSDFIPELPNWRDRSPFIRSEGRVEFYHYDLYSQALAKVERAHVQDLSDVREMLDRGLIECAIAIELFREIERHVFRYPAIDPPTFRRRVEEVFGPS